MSANIEENGVNKLNSERTHFTTEEAKWPSGLKTSTDVSDVLKIPVERVNELVDSQFMPHWRIDGGEPMFNLREVKQWAAENILKRSPGSSYPINLRVMTEPPIAVDAPVVIREIENLREVPIGEYPPGVYFLVKGNSVVYIGQSLNPIQRAADHRRSKDFDKVYMIPVPRGDLDAVEGALIRALNPKLNSGDLKIAYGPGCRSEDKSARAEFADGLAILEAQ